MTKCAAVKFMKSWISCPSSEKWGLSYISSATCPKLLRKDWWANTSWLTHR